MVRRSAVACSVQCGAVLGFFFFKSTWLIRESIGCNSGCVEVLCVTWALVDLDLAPSGGKNMDDLVDEYQRAPLACHTRTLLWSSLLWFVVVGRIVRQLCNL